MTNHPADLEYLVAQSAWLVQLARRLVSDPDVADDLAQQTLAAALERPPRSDGSLRGWLSAALRNFARQLRRGEDRRASREREALERTLRSAHSSEEIAASRTIAEVVQALEEPYRTTVILRYYDGLEPREIAALQRISVRTVDARLSRAHQRLRERLRREFAKERRDFALVLWTLASTPDRPRTLSPLAAGGILALVALALVVVVSAVLGTSGRLGSPATTALAGTPSAAVGAKAPDELAASSAPKGSDTSPVASPAIPATASTHDVRVLDARGEPVAGVALRFRAGRTELATNGALVFAPESPPLEIELGTSDSSGRVALPPLFGTGSIEPSDSGEGGFTALFAARVSSELGSTDLVVVVAPSRVLTGRVVDTFGEPIAGVELLLRSPEFFYFDFPEPLDRAWGVEPCASTDPEGRFTLASAPDVERATLEVTGAGFVARGIELPRGAARGLEIALAPAAPSEFAVHGHVSGGDGLPVADAVVACAGARASVDPHGRFALLPSEPGEAIDVVALAPGFLPAAVRVAGLARGAQWIYPEPVILRLSEPSLAIDGRVVDVAGRPVPHAVVFTPDTQVIWIERDLPTLSEAVMGSRADELLPSGVADENGAFHFDGLMRREYSLWAFDPRTCQVHEHGPVSAGSVDVRIELPEGNLTEVAGRLVRPDGEPVPGIRVVAYGATLQVPRPWLGDALALRKRGQAVVTDLDGRFHFPALDVGRSMLEPEAPDLFQRAVAYDPLRPAFEQEVLAIRHCYARLELADPAQADHFRFSNARGEPEHVMYFMETGFGGIPTTTSLLPLIEGKSSWVVVPETATTLHLSAGEFEVARIPVLLTPGEVTLLRH